MKLIVGSIITLLIFFQINDISAQGLSKPRSLLINSQVLGQERELKIHLPENYSQEKTYPVIYTTDGNTAIFDVAASYVDILSNPEFEAIPQCILVGIPQNDRSTELRPFSSKAGLKFVEFIVEEVVPFVDNQFNTSGFNAMIGHSDGAETNHFIMLTEGNPFRGFISVSTSFNKDVKDEISDFFSTYEGNYLYYFIASGERDVLPRIEAGRSFEDLYKKASNNTIKLVTKTYNADHQSLVPQSLVDGITYIFQDYKDMEKYASIQDYAENYLRDLKRTYGINGSFRISDTEVYWEDIFGRKNVDDYQYMSKFYSDQFGIVIDPLNHANNYNSLGEYSLSIENYELALEEIETIGDSFFYQNIFRAVNAYKELGKISEAILFLEKSRDRLPEKYKLSLSYRIAKLSLESQVSSKKGKKALDYCEENYRDNYEFTLDDLEALRDLYE